MIKSACDTMPDNTIFFLAPLCGERIQVRGSTLSPFVAAV